MTGVLDIYLVNGAPLSDPTAKGTVPQKTDLQYWNRLYHQKPDGTFEDVTEKAGLQGAGYGMGVAVGDYDNDGFEDLYVTAYGGNKLYHNNGNGTFTDVTQKAGVGRRRLVHQRGMGRSRWGRLPRSGRAALSGLGFRRRLVRRTQGGLPGILSSRFLQADHLRSSITTIRTEHFTEVAQKAGPRKPGKGLGIAIADYDRDGHIDLFVANDSMVEFLYHNKGDGTFEERRS